MGEQDSTHEQLRSSKDARVSPGTTAGGQRHATTHSSWTSGRSLEAELEYQSTLATLALVDEPEPVCVGHDGRYAIRRLIGRGAMGAVYFADDLALRRPVALKVVSKVVGDRQHFQDRLRREAWALALLDDPNVLQVYDVDVAASGELFIVMQYVAGQTLREWVERSQPTRAQLLEVFVAAGRGLAAAHRKGLVHRDFKPDNVLIRQAAASSGMSEALGHHVLVADFGLAGGAALELAAGAPNASELAPLELDALPVHTARFLGTPAYMSPEQRRCEALDGRSDQFSFCMSLWELMLGERPLGALIERRPSDLPAWLYRILRRGLATRPEQRYASMGELLDDLEHTPARRRRWLSLAGAAALGGVIVGGLAAMQSTRDDATASVVLADPCAGVDAPLAEVWSPARRASVEAALVKLELDDAPELAARTGALLDRAAARWRDDRRSSCELAPLADSPCHARWLARFDRRVMLLESLSTDQASALMQLVEPLLSTSICAVPPAPLEPSIQALLDQAEDAELLADYARGVELGERADAAAAELPGCRASASSAESYSLERAAAAYRIGDIYGEQHDGQRALTWLRRAARHARACEDDGLLLAAQLRAAKIQAVDLRTPVSAHEALLDAESLAARREQLDADLDWELHLTRGLVALERGELKDARSWLGRALALPDAHAQPLRASEALINLGVALYDAGDTREAMARFDEAAARIREVYGSFVPELDLVAYNRAVVLLNAGELDAARDPLEQLRTTPHVSVRLMALTSLAQLYVDAGELDAMRGVAHELSLQVAQHPAQSPFVRALGLYWAGQILANDGDPAGLAALREALELLERVAPTRAERDDCQLSLAWNLLEHGELDEAARHVRALEARELSSQAAEQLPELRGELQEKLSHG